MRLARSCIACAILMFVCVSLAHAASPARNALEHAVDAILICVTDPDYAKAETRPALRERIKTAIYAIFDFEEFSSRTVGTSWRDFTPEQRQAFTNAFATLLFSTYLDRVNGYNGERVIYTGEVASDAGDRVEVRTLLTLKDNKAVPVDYRMLPKGGTWRVYDVLIEGISLVKNYRTQFQDILSKGKPDELIARVLERARIMQDKSNALP